jgi:hypothetical protein
VPEAAAALPAAPVTVAAVAALPPRAGRFVKAGEKPVEETFLSALLDYVDAGGPLSSAAAGSGIAPRLLLAQQLHCEPQRVSNNDTYAERGRKRRESAADAQQSDVLVASGGADAAALQPEARVVAAATALRDARAAFYGALANPGPRSKHASVHLAGVVPELLPPHVLAAAATATAAPAARAPAPAPDEAVTASARAAAPSGATDDGGTASHVHQLADMYGSNVAELDAIAAWAKANPE